MSKEPREYFEDKFEAQLRAFKEELEEWQFKLENMGWESETDNLREVMELGLKLETATRKFQELRTASDSSWPLQKEAIENTLDEFGCSLKEAVSRWEAVLPE